MAGRHTAIHLGQLPVNLILIILFADDTFYPSLLSNIVQIDYNNRDVCLARHVIEARIPTVSWCQLAFRADDKVHPMLTVEQADGIVNSIMSLYTSDGYSSKQSHDDDHREPEKFFLTEEVVRQAPCPQHQFADDGIPVRGVGRKHHDALLHVRKIACNLPAEQSGQNKSFYLHNTKIVAKIMPKRRILMFKTAADYNTTAENDILDRRKSTTEARFRNKMTNFAAKLKPKAMEEREIKLVEIQTIEDYTDIMQYNDGDVAIVDNLHQLPMEQGLRMGLNAILLCTAGAVELDVREKHLVIWPDEVMICPPLEIVANIQTSRNFECKILFLTDRILKEFLRRNTQMWNRALYVERIDIISLSKEEVRRFLCFYELVKGGLAAEGTPYHKEEMHSLLQAVLYYLCGCMQRHIPAEDAKASEVDETIFKRFLELIASEQQKRQPVEYYASRLCITPKYLTMVCDRVSYRPASNWIRDYVVEDIRHYLLDTNMPVKQIADLLGFPNSSFFGTYVRQHLGMSPNVYRQRGR